MIRLIYFIVFLLALIMTSVFLIRNKKVDNTFILFSILVTLNCFGYYMLSMADTLETAIWANQIVYVGGCYAPLMTVILLSKLSGIKFSRYIIGFLAAYSTVVMGFILTINQNTLYYEHLELIREDGYSYLEKIYGPAHIIYPVLIVIYAIIILYFLVMAIRKRKEISIRAVVALCTTAVSIFFMYLLGNIIDSKVNLVSFGYITGLVFIIKYFENINMYDMSANILNSVENMSEYGYIAFDDKYRFISSNAFVKELFPEIQNWSVDRKVEKSDSYLYKNVVDYLYSWKEDDESKILSIDEHFYQLNIREFNHGKRNGAGYILEFIDRTMEQKYYKAMEEYNVTMEKEVKRKTLELITQQEKTQNLFVQSVFALAEAVDAKDRYTSGHSKRVAKYAKMIAARVGKSEEQQEAIYRAGLLHDVGKIRIPEEIINKPGRLTDEEFNIIKLHPITGYHILNGIADESDIAIAAKYHHEKYDGTGYPSGLAGNEIPEVARILAVADSYDAMASNRSYRDALPQEVVRTEIEKGKGTQFDPLFADVMIQMIDEDKNYELKENKHDQKTLLVIDKDVSTFESMVQIMQEESNYTIHYAATWDEAMNLVETTSYEIAFVGLDMITECKDAVSVLLDNGLARFNVLMTERNGKDMFNECKKYNCGDYVTMPFETLQLREVVHAFVSTNE